MEQERRECFLWDFLVPSFQSEEQTPLLWAVLGEGMVQGQHTPQLPLLQELLWQTWLVRGFREAQSKRARTEDRTS